ncbi:MAG: succinate dehydrogenase cytochrome b subunit [Deltaproteobacteria bacterium]|nr:succinate dehydrogenase cytochrome b subunit [Deltaproteobacteria bacterium]
MERALTLTKTTIGKKAIMALSGVAMLGFVVGHLAGNLKVFSGPEAFNEYAVWLRTVPALLWGTRLVLLAAVAAHMASAFSLWSRNRGARKNRYAKKKDLATDYAAKTMYWSGPILLFYILFHLLHLTFGGMIWTDGAALFGFEGYTWAHSNPYNNMVIGFTHWPVVVPYVLGVCALGIHLFHGIWSAFQSMGANHPRYNHLRRDLAIALAVFLTLGFLSIPAAAMMGWIEPTTQTFYYPELEPAPVTVP